MKTYIFDEYVMTLEDTGRRGEYGKHRVKYSFTSPQGEVLFQGEDLFASPMHEPESLDSAKALLSFLTLKPGDTDEEYFDAYTARQMEFASSPDIENLAIYTEEGDDNFDNFASKMDD